MRGLRRSIRSPCLGGIGEIAAPERNKSSYPEGAVCERFLTKNASAPFTRLTSACGTFETCRPALTMSVSRGRPEVVGRNPISLPGEQSTRRPGRRRAVDPKATEGRTAQKFVGFGINHSLTILRSTVAALFSHSYRPPWGIAAFLPDDRGSRGSGCHFQHRHFRGSCFRRRIGRADGYFYGPYSTKCRSQHRLAGGFD
jgi:hypothetical protein